MIELHSETYARCCNTLEKCDQFASHESLQAMFVTPELIGYRARLPIGAINTKQRVEQTLSFLLEQPSPTGRPVVLAFLSHLSHLYHPSDLLWSEIRELHVAIGQELTIFAPQNLISSEPVIVPYTVVAMTRSQAVEFIRSDMADSFRVGGEEREWLKGFMAGLQAEGTEMTTLPEQYADTPDGWRPRVYPYSERMTIVEIIEEIAGKINAARSHTPGLPVLLPQSRSASFFEPKDDLCVETWEDLRESGCLLLIDAISLFHPAVRQVLLESQITAERQTAMIVISPISFHKAEANHMIQKQMSPLKAAFARFEKHLDPLCEIGSADLRFLRRWLFAVLPEVEGIVRNKDPNAANLEAVRVRMPKSPRVDQFIFGQRGIR